MGNRFLTLLASTATAIGLASAANAADLPRTAPPPAPIAAVPVFTWTGFYVGVNAGYAWSDNNGSSSTYFIPPGAVAPWVAGTLFVSRRDGGSDGFAGGGQIGYNWQFGSLVLGAEADIQGIATDDDDDFGGFTFTRVPGAAGLPPGVRVVPSDGLRNIDWFGTVRGRLGLAFDRWLVYGTGGFAYGGGGGNGFCNGSFFDCNNDDIRTGWTAGGGVEWAFTNNLTARIEGLYVNLDDDGNRFNGVVFDPSTRTLFVGDNNRSSSEFAVVRAGLNWKFGTY